MKLNTLFFFCFVVVFFSIGANCTDGSKENIKTIPRNMKTCPYPLRSMIEPCRCRVDQEYRVHLFCDTMNEILLNTIAESFQCKNDIHRFEINMMGEALNCSFNAANLGRLKMDYFRLYNLTNINADIGPHSFIGSSMTAKEIKIDMFSGVNITAITVQSEAFSNLVSLENIQLDGHCQTLESKSFSNLPAVVNLKIKRIKIVGKMAFYNMTSLKSLDLAESSLETIETEAFTNLPNLSILNLTGNEISQIESKTFDNLPSLTEIYLNDNKIAVLQNNAFNNLPALRLLDLNQNDFKKVGNNLENIKNKDMIVKLSNTNIEFLIEGDFKGFINTILVDGGQGYIDLASVELECGCDVSWLFKQSGSSGVQKFHNVRCKDGHTLEEVDPRLLELVCPLQNCPHLAYAYDPPERCTNGVTAAIMMIEGRSVEVSCQDSDDGKAWTVIQRRGQFGNPEDHFSRVWTEYENGFGSPQEEVWLGLRNMAAMTNEGEWELQVDLEDWNGSTYVALFKKFSVGPGQRYELHISGFDTSKSTLAENGLGYHKGRPFSTKDTDQDSNSGNCATSYGGGGWWWGNCHDSCLNCPIYKTSRSDAKGITWYHGAQRGNTWKTWKGSVMKIRKVNP